MNFLSIFVLIPLLLLLGLWLSRNIAQIRACLLYTSNRKTVNKQMFAFSIVTNWIHQMLTSLMPEGLAVFLECVVIGVCIILMRCV